MSGQRIWTAAVLALVLASPMPAQATYAGTNGKIAFIHTWVGVGHRAPDLRLWVMDADGGRKRDLSGGASAPAFSPTGRTIAFGCWREGHPSHICVIDVGGRNKRQLTAGRRFDGQPVFSRDGRTIAFIRGRGHKAMPYAIDVAGGHARRISPVAFHAFEPGRPWVSSDGSTIVFADVHGVSGGPLFTAPLDRSERQPVPDSPDNAFSPAFSPNGRSVVFGRTFLPDDGGSYDSHHSDIYTMNLDGTGLRPLTHTRPGWSSSQPVWGPAPK